MRYGIINAMAEEKAALVAAMTDEKQSNLKLELFQLEEIIVMDILIKKR